METRNFETLELGKIYRAENGMIGKVVEIQMNNEYPVIVEFKDGLFYTYLIDGYLLSSKRKNDLNLIECLDNPTETKESIEAEIYRLQEKLRELDKSVNVDKNWFDSYIQVRGGGEYENKGFYLNSTVNWEIVTDSQEIQVLVPTKK